MTDAPRAQGRGAWRCAFAAAAVLFWGLRAVYWATTDEALFSDMADFYGIAQRFAAGGTLAHDDFWQSYRSPVLPLLGALKITLCGDGMLPWRIGQAALLFAGACWLAREVYAATGLRWLALALLVSIAISKPSIFWSLKFTKEGLHEALLYALLAAALRLCRRPSRWFAFAVGGLAMVATLNRSNLLAALPILIALPMFATGPRRRRALTAACVLLGIIAAWAPWGVRTWRLYGHPLTLTTDGAAVLLDGLHEIDVPQADGSTLHIVYGDHLDQARHRFANDAAADAWLGAQVRRWIFADPGRWLRIVANNVATSAFVRTISLSTVPRDHLLPRWLDWLLVDKHRLASLFGLLGLLGAGLLRPRLTLLGLVTVLPWLLACACLGLPRFFEPIVPLVLFGDALLVATVVSRVTAWRMRRCAPATPRAS